MKTRTWGALLAIYIAWGTTYLAIRYAVESIPPFFMAGTRFLVAGIILYAWRRLAGDPTPKGVQWRRAAVIGNLLLVGGIGGVSLAEQYVPSGIAALIVAATPLWVVLIDALRKGGRRPTWQTILGVTVGLGGIGILIDPARQAGGHVGYSLLGTGILLLAGFSWAVGSVISGEWGADRYPLMGTGMELLMGSAGSFLVGLILGEGRQLNLAAISLRSALGLGYLVVAGSLVGYVCYTWLLRNAPLHLVVTYAYVNPLVAVLVGSLLAGEEVTPKVLAAAPLILVAVILIHMKQVDNRRVARSPVIIGEPAGED